MASFGAGHIVIPGIHEFDKPALTGGKRYFRRNFVNGISGDGVITLSIGKKAIIVSGVTTAEGSSDAT